MSDKPLIEEIREIMWNPPASHSEKEEITRLRAEVQSLKSQIKFGDAMNDVAVKQRNYERVLNMRLQTENAELRNRLANLEDEKNDYINYVGDALGQDHDGESLWDAAQRVLSDRDRIRVERDELRDEVAELRAQIAAHERECAGVLVKVEERLPVAFRSVQTYHGESRVCHSNCVDRHGAWYVPEASHWLDARMPGGEG